MKPTTAPLSGDGSAPPGPDARPVTGLPARAVLAVLRGYKTILSPLFAGSCRFTPSCADYMAEAVRVHGAGAGVLLGLKRLARCHPFGAWGFDPVPPRRGALSRAGDDPLGDGGSSSCGAPRCAKVR